jgi:hypothetical protein
MFDGHFLIYETIDMTDMFVSLIHIFGFYSVHRCIYIFIVVTRQIKLEVYGKPQV